MSKFGIVVLVGALLSSASFGQTKKADSKMDAMSCPVCHMPLSKKKTAMNTVAVRLKKGGKVLYCCSKCTMPDSVLVKAKSAKPKSKA